MYLFILESIGTSELILIGVVALIVFGPRKLPQMAKTIGKTMAEFRNATNEFKSTWEKEVSFAEQEEKNNISKTPVTEDQISVTFNQKPNNPATVNEAQFPTPSIKQLSSDDIAEKFHKGDIIKQSPLNQETTAINKVSEKSEKRDWL